MSSIQLKDGSRLTIDAIGPEYPGRAVLSVFSPVSTVQIGVCMSLGDLAAIRDRINAVLLAEMERV